MKGYYDDPEATAEALRGGWFHTGDAAVIHPDGYAEIRDRIKDVIISGGENISSVEVEGVLLRHPAVQEVAIVGLPHERWGEAPHAFVVLKRAPPPPKPSYAISRGLISRTSKRQKELRFCPSCRKPPPAKSRNMSSAGDRRSQSSNVSGSRNAREKSSSR